VRKRQGATATQERPDLILLGRQAIATEYGQTGQMLAALLDWPQATFVSKLSFGEDGKLAVTREVDQGLQVLALQLPAVITTELCLNDPRPITLPNILKAKQKPVETILLEDLALDVQPRLHLTALKPLPKRPPGIKVKDVAELLHRLRYEAKVL
jgi:electron transfer flavoprotein beta subunit